ncbi:MAG: aldo/keto reductase, partial [Propionibacteriaceae bacterium]|nr:aldo/keto reductase [Propionibacteriaceae bacterium]
VPVLSLGTGTFGGQGEFFKAWGGSDVAEATRLVDICLEAGLNMFDSADGYSGGAAEEILGQAIRGRRDQVIISTKATFRRGPGPNDVGSSRHHLLRAVEGSLRRLGTDYIDLFQLHAFDAKTPIEETLEAMSELVAEGKVRYLGSSNLSAWQVVDADWISRTAGLQRFVSAQNEYSLYNRAAEAELVPACERVGVGILPYFPLAYGLLTGKYHRGEAAPEGTRLARTDQAKRLAGADWDRIEALAAFADARGIPMLTLAIGGLLAQPAVGSVISGATRPEQVVANAEAAAWEPSASDLAELAELRHAPAFSYTTFA